MTRPTVVVLGDVVSDVLVRLAEPIAPGSDTRAAIEVRSGGSAANQAAWLAAAGAAVHFAGRVGSDPFGVSQIEDLQCAGVITHIAVDPARSSGLIVVLVDLAGERTMLTDRGANLALQPTDLPTELFQPGTCFHLTGYSLFEPGPRTVALAGIQLARERGMMFSIDPSSASLLPQARVDRFREWTRGARFCFPNLDEGRVLTGEVEPAAVARALGADYGEVVLKLGPLGAMWAAAGADIVAMPAEPAPVVDTTGAGDAFCAGFLARRLAGADPADAIQAGLHLASTAVSRVGARPWPEGAP